MQIVEFLTQKSFLKRRHTDVKTDLTISNHCLKVIFFISFPMLPILYEKIKPMCNYACAIMKDYNCQQNLALWLYILAMFSIYTDLELYNCLNLHMSLYTFGPSWCFWSWKPLTGKRASNLFYVDLRMLNRGRYLKDHNGHGDHHGQAVTSIHTLKFLMSSSITLKQRMLTILK